VRIVRWLFFAYLVLLGISHLVRRLPGAETVSNPDLTRVQLRSRVGLSFREWGPGSGDPESPVVVLLHGSPGSSTDFNDLGPRLGERFRVIAPDLPGFGDSQKDVPEYSIRAHAAYVLELLDKLGIDSVHTVGFSMGGGVALEMIDQSPSSAGSLTLLSAIGIQELELLGNYHLNHAIHGFQLGLIWICREALPHFGVLDESFLGVEYARNFYDTDQRPLRAILERLEIPTLIVHGEHDILVPLGAAREHHRIVPQSELILFDASHFMVFQGEMDLAKPIGDFIARADNGSAKKRSNSSAERIATASHPFDPATIPPASGVTLLVLVGLIALATLLTEDLACIGAGLLVAQGRIGFVAATLACFVGIVAGDVLLYLAGRYLGYPWLKRAPLKWIVSPRQVDRASEWFQNMGPAVVFLTRFLPGTRVAAYTTAGLLRTGFWRFLFYFTLAVAIWTPFLVGISAYLGNRIFEHFALYQRYTLPAVVVLLLVLWTSVKLVPMVLTWKGRRRLCGWWCRVRRWEFWPLWAFYPPVLLWIGWLGLKYRSLTLFTAANPSIPAGGFVGESKSEILDQLSPENVAGYQRIFSSLEPEKRLELIRDFLLQNDLEFPIVLKPDVGQRGQAVQIARNWETVEDYCASSTEDFLVQRFVPGLEFGVFYVRMPDVDSGNVFSITVKELPAITGDGSSTIEELVLSDRRAVCKSQLYLERFESRLEEVPPVGEPVLLAELGTHCRGAIFSDGSELRTPRLESAIDTISKSFEGFFFGRYDIRVPSAEDLRCGRHIQILELNGVTSEATDIYDPRNSLFDAYKKLTQQWSLAFEIGHRNRLRGFEPEKLGALVKSILDYRRSQ
jgi:pimeloyl-ACP methyl ester carboxylesterase/membrane protein DedA with SNARE-associated domain